MKWKDILLGWLKLVGGLAIAGGLVAGLNLLTSAAPADVIQNNLDEDIDATPLFYSELGDISEFFEPSGKYYIDEREAAR